jgi:hypothetical protein
MTKAHEQELYHHNYPAFRVVEFLAERSNTVQWPALVRICGRTSGCSRPAKHHVEEQWFQVKILRRESLRRRSTPPLLFSPERCQRFGGAANQSGPNVGMLRREHGLRFG